MVVLWGLRSFHLVSSSTLTFSPRFFATSCTFSRRRGSRVGEERWGAYEESDRGKRLVKSVEVKDAPVISFAPVPVQYGVPNWPFHYFTRSLNGQY